MLFNLLTRLFQFLFPILKQAAIQAAADELNKVAYPPRRPRRRSYTDVRNSYERYDRRPLKDLEEYAKKDAATTTNLFNHDPNQPALDFDFDRNAYSFLREVTPMDRYHDVLLVAFDVRGRNISTVHNRLADLLPEAPGFVDENADFEIDAWWIADDSAAGDCDSAVFVAKGNQQAARGLLIESRLSH